MLTAENLSLRGNQPLNTAIPANLLWPDKPDNKDIVAPWLKPPSTIRLASVPDSTSVEIKQLIAAADCSIPSSSSTVSNPKASISNLVLER